MRKFIGKKFREYLSPVFSPASGLLFFTIILFHYGYFGKAHELHKMFRRDEELPWLFMIYAPFILYVNLFRVNGSLAGFAAFVTFVATVFGMMTTEISMVEGIRRPGIFDIIVLMLITIQAVVLTFRIIFYIRSISGIFSIPREMHFAPSVTLALILLGFVPLLTIASDKLLHMQPHNITDLAAFSGTLIIYLWKLTLKSAKTIPAVS